MLALTMIMPRPIWKGAITFGLVSVPVTLHPATQPHAEISFRLLHAKDSEPIDYRRVCSTENIEVPWSQIVRGYEYEKGRFVVFTREELERIRAVGTQMIEIRDFVPAAAIDFAYFESPYWLAPTRAGRKAYALLRQALDKSGRVGIGPFVMRQREHLTALRPSGEALMLTTMRFADELRSPKDLDIPTDARVSARELELALRLVESLAADWEPKRYRDTYRETLRAMIEAKIKGRQIKAPKVVAPPKVVNLVDALRESLERTRTPAPRRPTRRAAGRRRAA